MNLNKKAESIIWIVVAVSILSFAMLWIINILNYSNDVWNDYSQEADLIFLETNAKNIVKNLDLSLIQNNEEFYIYKDNATKTYKVYTWAVNEKYKYVDKFWDTVDTDIFIWNIFEVSLKKNINTWDSNEESVEYENVDVSVEKM
jgi:hypothetical protein